MTSIAIWQERNQAYLGAALRAIRLRLEEAAGGGTSVPSDLAAAHAAMVEAEAGDPPPAAVILRQLLGLSPFELNVLMLCAAMELDSRTAGLCARTQPDLNRPYPTFALALTLFEDAAWDALSPERPLRAVEHQDAHRHFVTQISDGRRGDRPAEALTEHYDALRVDARQARRSTQACPCIEMDIG
jgi:hypothetical protein